jgi:hypothetical protein
MTVVLDPTSERTITTRPPAQRPRSLAGRVVGLLDISKARGDVFLDRLEERLAAAGATVRRFAKPTFSKPAPLDLRQQIASQCEVLIEALAD